MTSFREDSSLCSASSSERAASRRWRYRCSFSASCWDCWPILSSASECCSRASSRDRRIASICPASMAKGGGGGGKRLYYTMGQRSEHKPQAQQQRPVSPLSPGMRVNARYINSNRGTSSVILTCQACIYARYTNSTRGTSSISLEDIHAKRLDGPEGGAVMQNQSQVWL